MNPDPRHLDPSDWAEFRASAHQLLDICIDRLANAEAFPWKSVPVDIREGYAIAETGMGETEVAKLLARDVLPYATGNTHPRFFGWVHGTGLASGILSEIVAATMNSNCGGRDHGLVYVERAVVDWAAKLFGFPETSSGLLVAGTSQATVIALSVARLRALGAGVRKQGQAGRWLTAYASQSVHSATSKAIELLGIGRENLRLVPEKNGCMDLPALQELVAADREMGAQPFAVVGTAGSVDFGCFDDLKALSRIARAENLWLHVDGAFGAWIRLADQRWSGLADGIEDADSIACDFHKWMYVPYDCGMVLIRDGAEHRAAFETRPSYLAAQSSGLGGGDPWYCDYGIDLSRGGRALKVWAALQSYGPERIGSAITHNCELAAYMGSIVESHPTMKLARPVVSNLCVFTANATLARENQSKLNAAIAQALQNSGAAVFSTTNADGTVCLRAAITNHRTTAKDIDFTMRAVRDAAETLLTT